MSVSNFICSCGFDAKNQKQLTKHQIKCNDINQHNDPNNKFHICTYCKKILTSKYNCERHMVLCSKKNINNGLIHNEKMQEITKHLNEVKKFITTFESSNDNEKDKIINSNDNKKYIDFIMSYKPDNQPTSNDQRTNNIQIESSQDISQSNNSNSNNTTNSNNINFSNNRVTINNTTNNNITVIYPFGFENIYFLTDYQMVDILTSRNCLIEAINKIYSHVENKNFMKRNMKREQMTIIDESLDIKVMNDNVFKRKVISNIFESLKRMFYHCKDKLKIEHQIMLWQNLRILDETIRDNMLMKREENMCAEIQSTMDTIMNIIAADNERPESRDCFFEIKNSMSNQAYKRLFNDKLNVIVQKIKEFSQDYKNREINLDFLRSNIWTSNLDTDQLLSLENSRNNILRNELELTPRYAFFRDMEIRENEYLGRDGHNTTGNIDNVCNIREQVAEDEFNKYNDKFEMEPKERKTLERKIKTETKYKARDKMPTSRKTIMKNIHANAHTNIPSITN
jgi:hypothetical protein